MYQRDGIHKKVYTMRLIEASVLTSELTLVPLRRRTLALLQLPYLTK